MSGMQGSVGPVKLEWITIPNTPEGKAIVRINGGEPQEVEWKKDQQGMWLLLNERVHGFDIRMWRDDSGECKLDLVERYADSEIRGLQFFRAGEEKIQNAGAKGPKKARIKAEMPGKIVSVNVKVGDVIDHDVAVLVMEAMKMENEIRAPFSGIVKEVLVTAGQAVETGAPLVTVETE